MQNRGLVYTLFQDLNQLFLDVEKELTSIKFDQLHHKINHIQQNINKLENRIAEKKIMKKRLNGLLTCMNKFKSISSHSDQEKEKHFSNVRHAVWGLIVSCKTLIENNNDDALLFNPLFTKEFFSLPKENELSANLNCVLPEKAETLGSFFASDQGVQFKKTWTNILEQLITWAKENELNNHALIYFNNLYGTYTGSNIGENENRFPLYQHGIQVLYGIVMLLKKENISLYFRRQVIANLITHMESNPCAPGAYTLLINAHLELLSQDNIYACLMNRRKEIAEQLAQEILRKYHVKKIMETHYITNVLVHFSKILNIIVKDEPNTRYCIPSISKKMTTEFGLLIFNQLTPERLIDNSVASVALFKTMDILNAHPKKAPIIYENFASELQIYGKEDKFYQAESIFLTEDYLRYQLAWHSDYFLFISLFHRLHNVAKFFNVTEKSYELNAEKKIEVHYISSYSLKFAYVFFPFAQFKHERHKPFIPFCIETLSLEDTNPLKIALVEFLQKKINAQQRSEVRSAILQYLNAREHQLSDRKKIEFDRLMKIYMQFLPSNKIYDWEMINQFSEVALNVYINTIDSEKLLDFVKTRAQLVIFYRSILLLPQDKSDHLIKLISQEERRNSYQDEETYVTDAFQIAVAESCTSIVEKFLRLGVSAHQQYQGCDDRTLLCYAIENNATDIVALLLKYGAANAIQHDHNDDEHKLLYLAMVNQNEPLLRLLVEYGVNINAVDCDGKTVLHWAATRNDCQAMQLLITLGAKVDAQDKENRTPLYLAVKANAVAAAKLLLDNHADVNSASVTKSTPLHMACQDMTNNNRSIKEDMINLLLSYKADVNCLDQSNQHPLCYIIYAGNIKIADLLINAGSHLHIVNKNEYTLLRMAVEFATPEMVSLLMKNYAPINKAEYSDQLMLHYAVRNKNLKVVKILLEHGANINVLENEKYTPFYLACASGNAEMIALFKRYHPNFNGMNNEGLTQLHVAIFEGNMMAAKQLINMGAKIDDVNQFGDTALHMAVKTRNEKAINALLALGFDINKKNSSRQSALEIAVLRDDIDMARVLLGKGADSNKIHEQKETLLHLAVKNKNVDLVKLLLAYKADVSSKDFDNWPPIYYAVSQGNPKMVKVLIDNLSPININNDGYVLLCEAAMRNNEIAEMLLEAKADPNSYDKDGNTALHIAIVKKNIALIKRLLACGADMHQANGREQTPFMLAKALKARWPKDPDVEDIIRAFESEQQQLDFMQAAKLQMAGNDVASIAAIFCEQIKPLNIASREGDAKETTPIIIADCINQIKPERRVGGWLYTASIKNTQITELRNKVATHLVAELQKVLNVYNDSNQNSGDLNALEKQATYLLQAGKTAIQGIQGISAKYKVGRLRKLVPINDEITQLNQRLEDVMHAIHAKPVFGQSA